MELSYVICVLGWLYQCLYLAYSIVLQDVSIRRSLLKGTQDSYLCITSYNCKWIYLKMKSLIKKKKRPHEKQPETHFIGNRILSCYLS